VQVKPLIFCTKWLASRIWATS